MSVKETTNRLSRAVANLSDRYAPAFITIIILACFFFYYFSVIVKNNESDLKERKFRGLYQVAANIKRKLETYQEKNVPNFISRIQNVNIDDKNQIRSIEKEYGLRYTFDTSLKSEHHSAQTVYDSIQKRFEFFTDSLHYASIDFRSFLQPLLRSDIFDNYFFAVNGSIILDDLNITESGLTNYISKTIQNDSFIKARVVPTGNLIKTNIGGKDFRLFSMDFFENGKIPFTIGGYLPDEDYEAERTYIPTYIILWLVIGVILVILMIPLLKIFKIHRSEQLHTMSVSSAFAAVHLLASIMILTILNSYVYFHIVRASDERRLKILADDIDNTLYEEIQADLNMMKAASDELKPALPLKDVMIHKRTPYEIIGDSIVGRDTTHLTLRKFTSLLYHIVWTDVTGMQRIRWASVATVTQKVDVSDRDYFKAVAENKMFYNKKGHPYYFTDISSWVSGRNYAVISAPTKIPVVGDFTGPELIMVSGNSRLKSMFSPIIPMGYGFCVVDDVGNVLFHQDERRNLNENIANECRDDFQIQHMLKHRSPGYFKAKYSGSNFQFYCKPIAGTNYSLLTFRDLQQSWAEDLDVISATSILVLLNLGIVLLAILVIRALSYTSQKLKTPSLAFTWLRPVSQLKKEYYSITCFYMLSMAVQICFVGLLPRVDNLSLLASTFTYTYLMLTVTFHQFSIHNNPQKSIFIRPKRIFTGLITFLLICILSYAVAYRENALWLIATVVIHTLIYAALTYRWQHITPVLRSILERTNTTWLKPGFRHSYTLFVTSLITATSIVPLLIFYVLCHDEQSKLSNKYLQWNFANQLSASNLNILDTLNGSLQLSYLQPFHYKFFAADIRGYYKREKGSQAPDPFNDFYRTIKPSFFYYNLDLELLNTQPESNREFSWNDTDSNTSQALYFDQKLYKPKTTTGAFKDYDGWKISNLVKKPKNHLASSITPSTILLMAGLLFSLYALLSFLIKKVFFEGAMEPAHSLGSDLLSKVNGNLFIYGPPGTNKTNVIKSEILEYGVFVELDLADLVSKSPDTIIPDIETALFEMPKDKRVLLITNINMYPDDLVITGQKLTIIEHFQKIKIRLIIISSQYFESLGMFEYNSDTKNEVSFTGRWQNLMESFYNVYNRWVKEDQDSLTAQEEQITDEFLNKCYHILGRSWPADSLAPDGTYDLNSAAVHSHILHETKRLIDLVRAECSHSAFLTELTVPMLTYASRLKSPAIKNGEASVPWPASRLISRHFIFVFEKVCDRIESLAANHYMSLWNAVSLEEQRTLYDIALDELVNPLNRKTAARLCEIGLVKPIEGIACYSIMNISFRSYILNQVANNEITIFKKEIAAKGFGSSIQLPLIIIAISAFAFIIITQKETFANLISYLGAGFAGITGLLKIISSIPASKGEGKA